MKKLKTGTKLVKHMGGGTRLVEVLGTLMKDGAEHALLHSLAPSNNRRNRGNVSEVPLGEDGLPDGYRLAKKEAP